MFNMYFRCGFSTCINNIFSMHGECVCFAFIFCIHILQYDFTFLLVTAVLMSPNFYQFLINITRFKKVFKFCLPNTIYI